MIQFDRQKFKAVVRHFCVNAPSGSLGMVALHKALYLSDMLHYLKSDMPLTGVEYRRQEFGPAATHLGWALADLAAEGAMAIRSDTELGFPRLTFVPTVRPDSDGLSHAERSLLDEVLAFVCVRQVGPLSELIYDAAWRSAANGETIPYFTAYLLVPCEVTDEDVAWGRSEASRLLARA